jgi:predicted lactoylglutathione lyase
MLLSLIRHTIARPWGIYSEYFRDPDGRLWEIIWNPS